MGKSDVAILILRITIGVIFVAHGLQKLPVAMFGGPGIEGMAGMLKGMGFTPPEVWAWIVAVAETAGGAFLILGILPRISAAAIAVVMIVAIVKVHWAKGLFAMNGGFEYPLVLLAVSVSLIITGAGKLSLFNKF